MGEEGLGVRVFGAVTSPGRWIITSQTPRSLLTWRERTDLNKLNKDLLKRDPSGWLRVQLKELYLKVLQRFVR